MEKITNLLLLATLVFAVHPAALSAEEFRVNLKTGSVLTINSGSGPIFWTDVQQNGEMQNRKIPLKFVSQLLLSESPASKQVAQIRQLLNQLTDPDYQRRENAEEQLSDPSIAGRFQSLVKAESENPSLEVRYRIERIMKQLDRSDVETMNEFDSLTLTDGTVLQGDAGDLRLVCKFRDQNLTLTRDEIQLITKPTKPPVVETAVAPVDVKLFHQHEGQFYQPNQTLVDFETSPGGDEIPRKTDVSDLFAPKGLLLSSEAPGFVGISGYGFRFPSLPPAKNSVCVFETVGSYSPKPFKGVMEIRFCQPNQKSVVAGVHEFGLFVARVNHRRDFIVEGYNADGQILATVEASDMGCIFAGIKSSEPITLVRILANPYLFRVSRKIDEDYAVDHVCFSAPVPVSADRASASSSIQLKNGDQLLGQSIQTSDDQVSIQVPSLKKRILVALSDIHTIRFGDAEETVAERTRKWLAMLDDRSVIAVNPEQDFSSELFGGLKFDPDQLTAFWFAKNHPRFPVHGDFEAGKTVMVFPTCRIASDDLAFQSDGYRWEKQTKLEQELNIAEKGAGVDEEAEEDPTPDITEVIYAETSPENIPTIWLRQPQGRQPESGLIRLRDGQQLVLGGASDFALTDIAEDSITIETDGKTESIPFAKILSIEFPGG